MLRFTIESIIKTEIAIDSHITINFIVGNKNKPFGAFYAENRIELNCSHWLIMV